jgi:hypothetical protein
MSKHSYDKSKKLASEFDDHAVSLYMDGEENPDTLSKADRYGNASAYLNERAHRKGYANLHDKVARKGK